MKQNLKNIIATTGGIIGVATSVFFLTFIVLAWTGPLNTPPTCPAGEVGCDSPLHTGTAAQSKAGGLLLNTGGATNGLIVENGNVGIGTTNPTAKLEVNGAIKIGETNATCDSSMVGGVRYVNGFLQICNGTSWSFRTTPDTDKEVTAFSIISPALDGVINGTEINITVPLNVSITSLTPNITITGISVFPLSGVAQDFTNPIIYTVTAEDLSTKNYTVSVQVDNNWYATSCGNFWVYKQDSGSMYWPAAVSTCDSLCSTCTLPTLTELRCICSNRESLGNNYQNTERYWSSDVSGDFAYNLFFSDCVSASGDYKSNYPFMVRCIRR